MGTGPPKRIISAIGSRMAGFAGAGREMAARGAGRAGATSPPLRMRSPIGLRAAGLDGTVTATEEGAAGDMGDATGGATRGCACDAIWSGTVRASPDAEPAAGCG